MSLKGEATHLLIELSGCDKGWLAHPKFLADLCDSIPEKIGMTLWSPCQTHYLDAEDPLDSGFTGFTLLKESHISYHAFHNTGFIYFDIFSCSKFNPDVVISLLVDKLKAKNFETRVIARGSLFNKAKETIEARIQRYDNPEGPEMGIPSSEDA